MPQDPVNIGTVANDGTGDTLRAAFAKLNANDAELYALIAGAVVDTPEALLAKLLTVDGPGSGLNADLLDGLSSADFAAAVHTHAIADITGLTAALAGKLDSSSYTAADVLAKLLTVDGSGSGIDADLLDGLSAAAFAQASHTHAQSEITGLTAALAAKLDASSYTAGDVRTKLLTVDGSGSGIDADLLDGQNSSAFAAASHAHAIADVTGLQPALDAKGDLSSNASVSVDSELAIFSGTTGKLVKRATGTGLATLAAGVLAFTDPATFAAASHTHAIADTTGLQAALDAKLPSASYTAADVLSKLLTVDGTGSGLDADLLDGQSAAAFAAASHTHAQSEITGLAAALAAKLDSSSYTAADVLAKLLTVDGPASGLDADTLDGVSSAGFAAASHSHAIADVTGLQAALDSKLASADYTAADVLAKLLTVDGASSGLDADLLDGISSAGFLQTSSYQALTPTWAGAHTFNVTPTVPAQSWTYAKIQNVSATNRVLGRISAGAGVIEELTGANVATLITYTAADVLSKLLTVDGAGSGLDADLLDGLSSAAFLQTSTYEALTPTWSGLHIHTANVLYTSANPRIRILETGLAADTGGWDFNFDGGSMEIRTRTDADGTGFNLFTVTRPSGSTTPQRVFIGNDLLADPVGLSTVAANNSNYGYILTHGNNSTNAPRLAIFTTSTSAGGFNTVYYGTSFSSPTQVATSVQLGNFTFGAYNTDLAAISRPVAVRATTQEAWSATGTGTALEIRTTAVGSITQSTTLSCLGTQNAALDGTAAAPSWTFQNDKDCGAYRITTNQWGLSANATLVIDISTSLLAFTATTLRFNTTTATTVGAAGGASALPATPLGYIAANISGTAVKIPYYNN